MVYCVEGADNNGKAWNFILPSNAPLSTVQHTVLSEPVVAIQTEVSALTVAPDATSVQSEKKKIIAIPYYTWANRGQGEMQVWLPIKINELKINR